LSRLKTEYGEKVRIVIVGVTQDRSKTDGYEFVDAPARVSGSYAAFVEWLVEQSGFDIGIAPLLDTNFNSSKSGIKFMDYAALGLAVVCSDVGPYREVVRNGETGLLVRNDEIAWYDALNRLVVDHQYRTQLAGNAREELIGRHTLSCAFRDQPENWPL
jgi:glycosyltransferase involved in cell wall biosynthesis